MNTCSKCGGEGTLKFWFLIEKVCDRCEGSGRDGITPFQFAQQIVEQRRPDNFPIEQELYGFDVGKQEITLVEVNKSAFPCKMVYPFWFVGGPDSERPYSVATVILSPEEWQQVLEGEMPWPDDLPDPHSLVPID